MRRKDRWDGKDILTAVKYARDSGGRGTSELLKGVLTQQGGAADQIECDVGLGIGVFPKCRQICRFEPFGMTPTGKAIVAPAGAIFISPSPNKMITIIVHNTKQPVFHKACLSSEFKCLRDFRARTNAGRNLDEQPWGRL